MKLEEQETGERANLKVRRGCGRAAHNRVRGKVEDDDTREVRKPHDDIGTMSDPQRKGKGKATTGKRKRGESSMSILDIMHDDSWREKYFTPQEKADQLLPANDPIKFANRYCELKYPVFATSRNLYLERTLKIPEELQQYTSD
ncbi:hypothetical protein HN873_067582 [Arachis hypogaea]